MKDQYGVLIRIQYFFYAPLGIAGKRDLDLMLVFIAQRDTLVVIVNPVSLAIVPAIAAFCFYDVVPLVIDPGFRFTLALVCVTVAIKHLR